MCSNTEAVALTTANQNQDCIPTYNDSAVIAFNTKWLAEGLGFREYLLHFNAELFHEPVEPVEAFVDDITAPLEGDRCLIWHDRLVPYGILPANCTEADFKALAAEHEFKYGEDYTIMKEHKTEGGVHTVRVIYRLNQEAFDWCISNAEIVPAYATFLVILRAAVRAYVDYQISLRHRSGLRPENTQPLREHAARLSVELATDQSLDLYSCAPGISQAPALCAHEKLLKEHTATLQRLGDTVNMLVMKLSDKENCH